VRTLAAAGCVAAGVFAYLWLDARDEARVTRERASAEAVDLRRDTRAAAKRTARVKLNQELAAERARHAREVAELETARGRVLEQSLGQLGTERDALATALREARERSQHLKEEAALLNKELDRARDSGEQDVLGLQQRLQEVESRMRASAQEATDRSRELEALESRLRDPTQGPLAEEIRGQLQRALSVDGPPDPAALVDAVGRGAWLLPFLLDHFKDGDRGVRAVALASQLTSPDADLLIAGIAGCARTDATFGVWAGRALRTAAAPSLSGRLRSALGHDAVSVRLAAVHGAVSVSSVEKLHPVLSQAFANDRSVVVDRALQLVADHPEGWRELLFRIAAGEDGHRAVVRATVWRRLLTDGDGMPRVARIASQWPECLTAAPEGPPEGALRDRLLVELLAQPRGPEVDALLERLLVAKDGQGGRTVWVATVERSDLRPLVLATARLQTDDSDRERARRLLPPSGVTVTDPAAVVALSMDARPVHLPFLVASAPFTTGMDRVNVARALHRLGHGSASAMVMGEARSDDPEVRAAAMVAMARLRLEGTGAVIMGGFYQQSPVREAAITAASELEMALPPELVDLLQTVSSRWTRRVLDCLGRHHEASKSRRRVLGLLAEDLIVDPAPAAAWLFAKPEHRRLADLRVALRHPSPAVRAGALEWWRRDAVGDGAMGEIQDLEPLVKDRDFRVRIQAARALAAVRHDLARTALVVLARDASPWVREEAVRGLGRQGSFHVLPVLRSALNDASPYVVNAARLSLLVHGVKDEAPALLKDVEDPYLGLRTRRALDRILGTTNGDPVTWMAAIENR